MKLLWVVFLWQPLAAFSCNIFESIICLHAGAYKYMSRVENTFRVMVWGGLCRSRLLVVTPRHLRRAMEPVLVLVAWGPLEVGADPKGQAVSGTRRGQGYVGTVWTWQGLHFLYSRSLTSSCKSVSLVWQWRAWSAGSPRGTGVRRGLCKVADRAGA